MVRSTKEGTELQGSTEHVGPLHSHLVGSFQPAPSPDRDHPGPCFSPYHHSNTLSSLALPPSRHCRCLSSLAPAPGLLSTQPWDLTPCFLPNPLGTPLFYSLPTPLLSTLSGHAQPRTEPRETSKGSMATGTVTNSLSSCQSLGWA